MLTVEDMSTFAPGRLVNGTFALAQPLQVSAGGEYGPVPRALKSWVAPVSNDPVTLGFRQAIGANEPLRTGSYAKTLTFTLSTTNP